MIVGINKQKHKLLIERLEKLKALSDKTCDEDFVDESQNLESELIRLEESFKEYDLLLQQLASSRDAYGTVYQDVSANAYRFIRKLRKQA